MGCTDWKERRQAAKLRPRAQRIIPGKFHHQMTSLHQQHFQLSVLLTFHHDADSDPRCAADQTPLTPEAFIIDTFARVQGGELVRDKPEQVSQSTAATTSLTPDRGCGDIWCALPQRYSR